MNPEMRDKATRYFKNISDEAKLQIFLMFVGMNSKDEAYDTWNFVQNQIEEFDKLYKF